MLKKRFDARRPSIFMRTWCWLKVCTRQAPMGLKLVTPMRVSHFFVLATIDSMAFDMKMAPFMDVDLRLAAMDKAGIDFQVLSPNPLTYFHFIEANHAIRFCREHNNALASLIANKTSRLAGFCALPMQDIPAACDELERAVNDLGLLGAYIGTDFGVPLNSPELDPLYEKCVALDVPLFIHPAPAGIDGPSGDVNLKQFDLDLLTGFAGQESIAVATLIYGGVLERHPALDICLSHAGGAVVALIGRLNMACVKRAWVPEHLRYEGAFEEQLSKHLV
jgi:aminocarboxymuconate-semialdehyde decarboxylase